MLSEGQLLRRNRSRRTEADLGDWFIVDLNLNTIEAKHCDVAKMAEELSVLKPWEVMEGAARSAERMDVALDEA